MASQRNKFNSNLRIMVAILLIITLVFMFHSFPRDQIIVYQNANIHSISTGNTPINIYSIENELKLDHYKSNNAQKNMSWLDMYNKTKLKQDLQLTVNKYSNRMDRITPSIDNFISINDSTILFRPFFKDPKFGPILSLYWQSRMISFFSQFYKFKLKQIDKEKNISRRDKQRYSLFCNEKHFISFLAKYADIHAIDIDYNTYSKYGDWMLFWMLSTRTEPKGGLYIYGMDHMELLQSKIFTNIIIYETNIAFNAYYKINGMIGKQTQNLIKNEMWISKTDDVLIHIRCQDVLLNGQRKYGMSSLHYFYTAIINIFNIKLHSKMAIHIVLYLGKIAGGGGDHFNECYQYLFQYLYPSFLKIFKPAQIKLITNGTVDDDFYRFIKAPHLICGTSSYCLMGAIANKNNVVLSKLWTSSLWYEYDGLYGYKSFGAIANNIHFLDDPYFLSSERKKGWKLDRIAHETMVINGKYVL